MFIFILIFLSLFALLNYYVGKHLFSGINNFKKINKLFFWILYSLLPICFSLYMMFGTVLPKPLTLSLYYLGNYYLAAFFYLILIIPILDLLKLIFKNKLTNKKYISKYTFIFVAIFIFTLLSYGTFNAKNSYVKTYNFSVDKSCDISNLNIVLVSDIHLGDEINREKLSQLINEVNALNPDIILIAGDLIDMSIKPFIDEEMYKELANFKSKYGTFLALGNHDIYAGREDELTNLLKNEGINVLRDESILVNDSFYILGRDDKSIERTKSPRKSLSEITSGLDKSKPSIIIDHTPDSINDSINSNIDIQVSGHTHRGQLFPGNLITSLIFPLDYGYDNIDGLNLIVSSGYGYWGPPVRLGSRSEIVNLKVTFQK
ncbi:MAG: metallophosphoesterase [Clostridium sp.]